MIFKDVDTVDGLIPSVKKSPLAKDVHCVTALLHTVTNNRLIYESDYLIRGIENCREYLLAG